jgi:hypothetical protein
MFPKTDEHEVPGATRVIRPSLPPGVMTLINAFIDANDQCSRPDLARKLRKIHVDWQSEAWSLKLRAVALVIADLLDQGWMVAAVGDSIELRPPGLLLPGETVERAKKRLREALLVARRRQLEEPGVLRFLQRMHRVVRRQNHPTSIAHLVDNGAELARLFRHTQQLSTDQKEAALSKIIDPVIEGCDEDARCAYTGLRLIDIWRYFRHTWSLEYRPIPGRQLPILIRNAARPGRPVMGIAMLASPVVRSRTRDDWIGWTAHAIFSAVESGAIQPNDIMGALLRRLNQSISEIRSDDLASPAELADPTERTVLRLEQRAAGANTARVRQLQRAYEEMFANGDVIRPQRDSAKENLEGVDIRTLSDDPLFVYKRADTLWKLLDAKRTFSESRAMGGPNLLDALLRHPRGERALSVALLETRKAGLASQVMDLSVCGAVAPYNIILGGKLVALLMGSADTLALYRRRYAGKPSLISSQMAGRLIYRPAELKVLTTTSLYGNGSSQYNRLRLRVAEHPELEFDLTWSQLEQTMGYGTYHLAPTTLRTLRDVSDLTHGARRINNRFGEGASPRLRQTRQGLDALGIDSAMVLHHATPRLLYACEVHRAATTQLLGLQELTVSSGPAREVIARAWLRRWLVTRINQPEILDRLARLGPATVKKDLLVPDDDGQFELILEAS